MIATIACGTIIVLSLFVAIVELKDGESVMAPYIAMVIFAVVLCLSYMWGYSRKLDMAKKRDMLILYENCPCGKHLDGIYSYNISVDGGNNLWCRFKKEDRSEYLIDIDELLKGTEKNE